MKWFFAISDGAPVWRSFCDMVKVAVWTAKQHTTLKPYCLYDGSDQELPEWLRAKGVTVIPLKSRFYDRLKEEAARQNNEYIFTGGRGSFLRIEIAALEGLFSEGEYALYTDCDVMFQCDPVPLVREMSCEFFAAAPEFKLDDYSYINSGVMLMNIKNLKETLPDFTHFANTRFVQLFSAGWDQAAYNWYYQKRITRLAPEMNWKTYWGVNPKATIIHFHGPKPTDMARYARGEVDGLAYLITGGYWEYGRQWEALLREANAPDKA